MNEKASYFNLALFFFSMKSVYPLCGIRVSLPSMDKKEQAKKVVELTFVVKAENDYH